MCFGKRAARIVAAVCALIITAGILPFAEGVFSEPAAGSELDRVACALLCDPVSGRVLIDKNADAEQEFAGLVRLPALLEICAAFDEERIFGNTIVTVSKEAAAVKGATAFLAPNERMSAELLLKAAVMLNAGDAVMALMESLFPSSAAAAEALTAGLYGLGIEKQASGYLCEGLALTALELAKVCGELIKSPSFLKYSSVYTDTLPHASASDTELVNPNRLVRHYSGCMGLATGSVGGSMYCGAFAARRGGTQLLAIVAGAGSSDARFIAARELLDYGFSAYRCVQIRESGEEVAVLPAAGGLQKELSVVTEGEISALLPVSDARARTELLLPHAVSAPIEKGQRIGVMRVFDGSGVMTAEAALIAGNDVKEARFGDYFVLLAELFLNS